MRQGSRDSADILMACVVAFILCVVAAIALQLAAPTPPA